MTQKIHEYSGSVNDIVPLMKWLRQHGENGSSYKIHQSNYRKLCVEFFDNKLELMYIMKYDWGNNASK